MGLIPGRGSGADGGDIAPEIPVATSMTDAAADNVIPLDDEIGYCRYSQITGRCREPVTAEWFRDQ